MSSSLLWASSIVQLYHFLTIYISYIIGNFGNSFNILTFESLLTAISAQYLAIFELFS